MDGEEKAVTMRSLRSLSRSARLGLPFCCEEAICLRSSEWIVFRVAGDARARLTGTTRVTARRRVS